MAKNAISLAQALAACDDNAYFWRNYLDQAERLDRELALANLTLAPLAPSPTLVSRAMAEAWFHPFRSSAMVRAVYSIFLGQSPTCQERGRNVRL